MKKKPAGRRSPERTGGADGAAPSRSDDDEPIDKVAPWRRWKRLSLRASAGNYPITFTVSGAGPVRNERYSELITTVAHERFKIAEPPPGGEGPAAYLVEGRLRVVYDELIVQFEPDVPPTQCRAILEEMGFHEVEEEEEEESPLFCKQWIVRHARPGVAGESLLRAADGFRRFDEVRFAWPNSLAEYLRASNTGTNVRDWWLHNIGVNGPAGERLLDTGNSSVKIAVLDDGVDIAHLNLVNRVAAGTGRDFALAANRQGHNDPRPKVQGATAKKSDYHGTCCAGLICSDGNQNAFLGVAPGCTLVAVRVIIGSTLVSESKLAKAIRYATIAADVISCSWTGPKHDAVVEAINDTKLGRVGKGSVVVCAAGNNGADVVRFPARHSRAIAVGACGPQGQVTPYANYGDRLDVVAPSNFNDDGKVYSTDVSTPGWGYDPAGLFWDAFGGTSAATAIAAGVAALCLSANPNLKATELRGVLQATAAPVGENPPVVYDAQTKRSEHFGYGRINAALAVATAKQMLGA